MHRQLRFRRFDVAFTAFLTTLGLSFHHPIFCFFLVVTSKTPKPTSIPPSSPSACRDDDGRGRTRSRVGVSQSQPGSRSGSPGSTNAYLTYGFSMDTSSSPAKVTVGAMTTLKIYCACVRASEREIERETLKERETETDTQTHRQTQRHTERQTDSESESESESEREADTDTGEEVEKEENENKFVYDGAARTISAARHATSA